MIDNEILQMFRRYSEEGLREEDILREYYNCAKLRKAGKKEIHTIGIYYATIQQGGGVRRVISLLVPLYLKLGYRVVLITEEEPTDVDYMLPAEVKRYSIVSTSDVVGKKADYEERGNQLASIFTKENIDVICSHDSCYPLLFYDLLLARSLDVYFIIINHQVYTQELVRFENYYVRYRYLFMLADKLIVLSSYEEQYWKALGVNAEYIANPITYEKNWVKKDNEEYIVWVGRLDIDTKNFLDVIPIMEEVHKRFPKVKLRVYGEGSQVNIDCLQTRILESGLAENIEYCGQTKDLNQIYGQARIHLVTSASETFPMGIYEGKMYGIPLITYELPSVEILENRKGVMIVPQRNTKRAAEAVIAVLSNPELERRLQKEAKESADCMDAGLVERKWQAIFQNLPHIPKEISQHEGISEESFRIILETIFAHYHNCIIKHRELQKMCKEYWEKSWLNEIKYRMLKDNLQIAIYPYGKIGKMVKRILNENDIWESLIVDNYKEGEGIVGLKELEEMDTTKYLFLVCSSTGTVYIDIREQLARYVCPENIYDLCPAEMVVNHPFSYYE